MNAEMRRMLRQEMRVWALRYRQWRARAAEWKGHPVWGDCAPEADELARTALGGAVMFREAAAKEGGAV